MIPDVVVRNVVLDLNTRRAGIVVVKLPSRDGAVVFHAAPDINNAGRTKISPGKFLFARPGQLHGFTRRARQTCSFDSAFARVFTPIARASVGNNDTNFVFRDMKRFC